MSRVKIVTHRNGWSRLAVLLGVSLALVILALATRPWTSYTRPPVVTASGLVIGSKSIHIGVIAVLVLLLPLLLFALSRSEQRWGYAALEALAVWLGALVGVLSWTHLFPVSSPRLEDVLFPGAALVVPYLLARIVGLMLVRFMVVSVVYQDGTLCSSCGYDLTGNTSGVCSECGARIPVDADLTEAHRSDTV